MEGHWLEHAGEFLVQLFHLTLDGERAPNSVQGVLSGRAVILENHHEPVAGGLVYVPLIVMDNFEEAGEIPLEQPVYVPGIHLLREAGGNRRVWKNIPGIFFSLFPYPWAPGLFS